MAAVRELIQNARDAMALKAAVAVDAADRAALTLPISVNLSTLHEDGSLEIVDHGIGMNRLVMTDYLISIASNYWVSQVSRDFPEAALTFKSAGKFGIGFLSVFMLGDEVVVESNRQGSERLKLTLNGVGRRGELLEVRSPSGSGTSVRIKLKKGLLKKIDDLPRLIRTYAPTLPFGITINVDDRKHHLVEGWIKTLSCSELETWTIESSQILNRAGPALGRRTRGGAFYPGDYLLESRFLLEMRVGGPARRHLSDSYPWRDKLPEYTRGNTRLVASFFGESVLSMRGLAVQMIQTPGCAGIIELDNLETDVARSRVLNENASRDTLKAAREAFIPNLTLALDAVGGAMTITNVLELLARCVGLYGPEAVRNSGVPWISQLTLPGNVETISCSTLVARLIDTRSCFVAFNVGPWSSLKRWVETAPGGVLAKDEVAVVLDDAGQRGPGYVSGEKKLGALRELREELDANSLFFI
jgi:hypothetical protein